MYEIEIKPASKNGWFTPAEARSYYGRYSRDGLTVHWWNTREATAQGSHDNIVNYFLGQASAGNKSVNYVLSDSKITLLVYPDDVAWASQGGNPTTVSVEFDPWLGDEGYKKGGWLLWQLEERWGKGLRLYKHSDWFGTACPGDISPTRLRAEADKWKAGGYNPKPAEPEWTANRKSFAVKKMYCKDQAKLVDVNTLAVKSTYALDTPMDIKGETTVQGREFWISAYSMDKNLPNGFLKADLKDAPTPPPEPAPQPQPAPVQEPKPEPSVPAPDYGKENNSLLKQILAIVEWIKTKLEGIFK